MVKEGDKQRKRAGGMEEGREGEGGREDGHTFGVEDGEAGLLLEGLSGHFGHVVVGLDCGGGREGEREGGRKGQGRVIEPMPWTITRREGGRGGGREGGREEGRVRGGETTVSRTMTTSMRRGGGREGGGQGTYLVLLAAAGPGPDTRYHQKNGRSGP